MECEYKGQKYEYVQFTKEAWKAIIDFIDGIIAPAGWICDSKTGKRKELYYSGLSRNLERFYLRINDYVLRENKSGKFFVASRDDFNKKYKNC